MSTSRLLVIGTSVDPHIQAVLDCLDSSITVTRFDVDLFPCHHKLTLFFGEKYTSCVMSGSSLGEVSFSNFDTIWFRRLGAPVVWDNVDIKYRRFSVAEAEHALTGILSLFPKSIYINELWATRQACYKPVQYLLARNQGMSVPDGLITNDVNLAFDWLNEQKTQSLAKTLSAPVLTFDEDDREFAFSNIVCCKDRKSLECVGVTSTQFQKVIDPAFELRVTTIGNVHYAVRIDSNQREGSVRDWRSEKIKCSYSWFELPIKISNKLSKLIRSLGLDFSASDFIVDSMGNYFFLETNPHGAWLWLEKELGDSRISNAMADYIKQRCMLKKRNR